ncbi:MAG: hypothetical protein R3A10_03525 [Caldilineaceae bacterium]
MDAAFAEYGDGDAVPVWVTEYNLTAPPDKDTDQLTTRWVTGLFMADTVGQILSNGFAGAPSGIWSTARIRRRARIWPCCGWTSTRRPMISHAAPSTGPTYSGHASATCCCPSPAGLTRPPNSASMPGGPMRMW